MRYFSNIEPSAFRQGQYVGYGGGKVWKISASVSYLGRWIAINQANANDYFHAWRLVDLNAELVKRNEQFQPTH